MSPILGNDMTLMPEFARGFTRLGYHAAVVKRKEFAFDAETAMQDAEKEFRLLVMRAKQALDWLERQEDVDGSRIATFGVSAGAIISACVAGADRRPKAHVLVLGGGPTADVLLDTTEGRFERYGKAVAELTGQTKDEIRVELRAAIRTDPVALAPRVPREDVLMFVAKQDESVPTQHGITLWNAYGRPEIRWLPWGHYTSFLLFWWMQNEANAFLRAKLGPP
jgi:dienelactone hydrolase